MTSTSMRTAPRPRMPAAIARRRFRRCSRAKSVTLDGTHRPIRRHHHHVRVVPADRCEKTEDALGTGLTTLDVSLPDGANDIRLHRCRQRRQRIGRPRLITIAEAREDVELVRNAEPDAEPAPHGKQARPHVRRTVASTSSEVALTADQRGSADEVLRHSQTGNTTSNQVEALEELIPDDFAVGAHADAAVREHAVRQRHGSSHGAARRRARPEPRRAQHRRRRQAGAAGAAAGHGEGVPRRRRERRRARRIAQRQVGPVGARQLQLRREGRDRREPELRCRSVGAGRRHRLSRLRPAPSSASSLAYGESSVEFTPSNEGALDTDVVGRSRCTARCMRRRTSTSTPSSTSPNVELRRRAQHHAMSTASGLVDADATGDTDGMTFSGGLSGGYDFLVGGLTLSPKLGLLLHRRDHRRLHRERRRRPEPDLRRAEVQVADRQPRAARYVCVEPVVGRAAAAPARRLRARVRGRRRRVRRALRRGSERGEHAADPGRDRQPRRVVLAPGRGLLGAVQVRRVGLRRVSAPGELRVHQLPGRERGACVSSAASERITHEEA